MRTQLLAMLCLVWLMPMGWAMAAAQEPAGWTAPPETLAGGQDADLGKLRLEVPVTFPNTVQVAWPVQPGPRIPIAVVAASRDCQWNILDLPTGKLSPAAASGWLDNAFASSDGKYIAGEGKTSGTACEVWSLTEKKKVVNIPTTGSVQPKPLTFHAAKANLLLVSHVGMNQKETITETDIASGKEVRTYTLPVTITPEGSAVSPGGKYLAVLSLLINAPRLYLCDLETGKVLGSSPVPPNANRLHYVGFPAATAFSDDGSEVAVLFKVNMEYRFIQWKTATGQVDKDLPGMKIDLDIASHEQGPMLQYVPGGKWLRISHFIYDRETGKLLDSIPMPSGKTGKLALVQMIAAGKALVVTDSDIMAQSAIIATERVGD